jgi:hypothetical protein
MIIDKHGRILLWHLPNIISEFRIVSSLYIYFGYILFILDTSYLFLIHLIYFSKAHLNEATETLSPSLINGTRAGTWRQQLHNFDVAHNVFGSWDLSPAWFARGQDVS